LEGLLEPKDSVGLNWVIYSELPQKMSAGSGIFRSEVNQNEDKKVCLNQLRVVSGTGRTKRYYQNAYIGPQL
jgi:quercetin 2,3-dioxygenase